MEAVTGAVIKGGLDLLSRPPAEGVALIPRLVVRGNESGAGLLFNLELSNVGKRVAYGVQLAVPWSDLSRNGSKEGLFTEWWELDKTWAASLFFDWLTLIPGFGWLRAKRKFRSKDVGMILAPGESVQLYFGQHRLEPRNKEGILLRTGQITSLTLYWYEGAPCRLWPFKRSTTLNLAIHSSEGVSKTAHTAWEPGDSAPTERIHV